ncbi:hypothetical protein LEMLEM_LOCUS13214, partial [Lemmus lemmus]
MHPLVTPCCFGARRWRGELCGQVRLCCGRKMGQPCSGDGTEGSSERLILGVLPCSEMPSLGFQLAGTYTQHDRPVKMPYPAEVTAFLI